MSGFYASQWKTQITNRATSYVGDLNTLVGDDDYGNNALASTYTTGGGAVTFDSGLSGGVARLRTGGIILVASNAETYNEGGGHMIGNPTNESWYAHARCKFIGSLNAVNSAIPIGIQSGVAASGVADYIQFGYNGALGAETTYLSLVLELNSGGGGPLQRTTVSTNKAPDFTNWRDYAILRKLDTGLGIDKLIVLIDDEEVLNLDGPFPHLTANPAFRYSWAYNAASATPNAAEMLTDNTCILVKGV